MKCTKCLQIKTPEEFNNDKKKKSGKSSHCKKCTDLAIKLYRRTITGFIYNIYYTQRKSSRSRGHILPNYTKEDLLKWVLCNPKFKILFNNWVSSGYVKNLTPSLDRLNDYLPYTLNNLQLGTWKANYTKAHNDIKLGINNKKSTKVIQLTLNNEELAIFNSQALASKKTGVQQTDISSVCRGKRRTAGGFIWKYAVVILFLFVSLQSLSQTIDLTREQKTRVLEVFTPSKIIDISKGIDNEKRQYAVIIELQTKIDSLKSLAAAKDFIITEFRNEVVNLNAEIKRITKEEDEVADNQLKHAKKPFLGLHMTARLHTQGFQTDKISLQTNIYYKLEQLTLGASLWSQSEPVFDGTFKQNFYIGPYLEYKIF